MNVASKQQINSILLKIKESIQQEQGKNFIFKNRDKNKATLTKLGWLPSHVKQEILTLTYKNYSKGPEQNKSSSGNNKGSVWTFGKKIEGLDIYIKVHVIPFGVTQCVCISFHEEDLEEGKLTFPYADEN
ncbi:type II toxin-antitoxin system MqsR family toxin [Bacillus kwashiorkori]|uniref:type II toxin-antitoxin system MqsR family toxin n=1 Tax=Bacillus kwashiorkori TaxID=1522318 RepID=UPI0007824D88|nr:type II toxin-antitoxin system MqsR family toxin [Bacillus kwashiorkori]